jgi:ornithine carbamoyltransferase
MDSMPQPADLQAAHATPPNGLAALVEGARALQRAAQAGAAQPWLRGKRFGLLLEADGVETADTSAFDRAAIELGAQVAHIRPRLTEFSAAHEVQQTAQMLGRLYDAVVCEGLPPSLVRRLRIEAGVPVYDGIGASNHPVAQATQLLDPAGSIEDKRRFVLQALLLQAVA